VKRMLGKSRLVFFKKPEHFLPFLGALIVFTTYVVKEGFLDKYKTLGDTIDQAESAFMLRGDLIATQKELHGLTLDLRKMQSAAQTTQDDFSRDSEELFVKTADVALSNTARLLEKLPKDQSQQSHQALLTKILRDEQKYDKDKAEDEDESSPEWAETHKASTVDLKAELKKDEITDEEDEKLLPVSLEDEIDVFSAAVLQRAELERKKDDQKRDMWKLWSTVLYVLGWTLGLTGKLLGVEVIPGD
jgi:hypothetical protein